MGFSNILETILENRGIKDIKAFLNPSTNNIEDINNYDNIDKWIEIFIKHIKSNSNVCIIVDADFDGFSSASLMYQYIKLINPNINIKYLVHEGKLHGLKDLMKEIEVMKDQIDLLIVPDAGSNDIIEHEILFNWGIDTLIADHHEKEEDIRYLYSPFATIVNNQFSNNVNNKTLTGVGVCYKICKEIDKRLNVDYADRFLDLVTVGMIADVCDLSNLESRYLVNEGLIQIDNKKNYNILIKKLIEKQAYSMKNKVNITGIAFYICPLINAVTRMGTREENKLLFESMCNINKTMVDTIRGKGEVEMTLQDYIIRVCEKVKRKQKKLTDKGVVKLDEQIKTFNLNEMAIMICNGTELGHSLGGLVANKIASKYQKPCIILRKDNEAVFKGSGRGFKRNAIKDLRRWCLETKLFNFANGHAGAFGCSIGKQNIDKLYNVSKSTPYTSELVYDVDAIYNAKSLNSSVVISISKYGDIWGCGIDEPMFAITDLQISHDKIQLIGKAKNTIKFTYNDIEFIKFSTNELEYNEITKAKKDVKFTIIGRFSINEYNGNTTPQILIEDMTYETVDKVFRF
jgi:single-stranded-DNA-specific exonuclease